MIDTEFDSHVSPSPALARSVATSLPPFETFEQAARAVLGRLRADTGFALWALTRLHGNDCVLLAVDDDNYGLRAGMHLPWTDSLCARMTRGTGPQATPDVLAEPDFRDAPPESDLFRVALPRPRQPRRVTRKRSVAGSRPTPRESPAADEQPKVPHSTRKQAPHDVRILRPRRQHRW